MMARQRTHETVSFLVVNMALGAESVTILELEPRRAWKFSRPKRANGAGAPMRCTGVGRQSSGGERRVMRLEWGTGGREMRERVYQLI